MKTIKRLAALLLAVVVMAGVLPVQGNAAEMSLSATKAASYGDESVTFTSSSATTVQKPYLNNKKKTLAKGESYTLKLIGTKAVSWKSNNKSVATVNKKGKVKAKKAGKATITCKGKDKKTYKCKITVTDSGKSALTEEKVYQAIIAMKSKYPEGRKWTNDNFYAWKGGIYSGGYGCAGFAFALSDAAFGSLPARTHKKFSDVRVGDILRINYNTHSVIVLEVRSDSVIVAEGNYGGTIHWGREISSRDIRTTGTYVMTRYPK